MFADPERFFREQDEEEYPPEMIEQANTRFKELVKAGEIEVCANCGRPLV